LKKKKKKEEVAGESFSVSVFQQTCNAVLLKVLGKSVVHDDQRRVVLSAYKSRISYGFMAISCISVVLESVTASLHMILKQNSSKSAFIHHIQRGNRKTDR
jgi:hypothetical protein